MIRTFDGGCLCGAVRYTCTAEPLRAYFCHCLDCQKESGAAFATELSMRRADTQLTGATRRFSRKGDSGQAVHRNFCIRCGTVVLTEFDVDPDHVGIKAGTLDDASWVQPQFHVYIHRKQPWITLTDDLPRYAGDIPPGA
jgi:hypothetical protein